MPEPFDSHNGIVLCDDDGPRFISFDRDWTADMFVSQPFAKLEQLLTILKGKPASDLPSKSRVLLLKQLIADKTRDVVDRFIVGWLQPASPSPPASPEASGSCRRCGGGGGVFGSCSCGAVSLELPRAKGS